MRHHTHTAGRPRADFREREMTARRIDAEAVRPEQTHAAGARGIHQLLLQRAAFIHFAKATGNHLRKTHAAVGGFEQGRNLCAGNRDEGVINRLGRVGQTAIRLQTVDLGRTRMNWINRSGKTELANAADKNVGQRRTFGRGTDNGNGLRFE